MRKIKIDNKEYTFEFTIEASLYDECTEKLTTFIANMGDAQNNNDIKKVVSSISNIPQTALSMFYAGLLEYHGENGDGEIISKKDAKILLRKYFKEKEGTGEDDFYSLMSLMIEIMGEDGFFKRVGLEKMFQVGEETVKKTAAKKMTTQKATKK